MKHDVAVINTETLSKIASIEHDIALLKLSILKKIRPSGGKIVKLRGILKSVDITENDIISVRKSLYDRII